jgi:hypothetical protein
LVSGGTVAEDFDGFYAIVDSSDQFPTTTRKSVLIRPGHNNIVSMDAVKVSASRNIEDIDPEKRFCLFHNEMELKVHKNYTQANCILECNLNYARNQVHFNTQSISVCIPSVLS